MELDGVSPRSVNSRRSALNRLCACLGHRLFQTHDLMREEPVRQLTRAERLRPLRAARAEI